MGGVLTSSGNGQVGTMALQPEAAGDVPKCRGSRANTTYATKMEVKKMKANPFDLISLCYKCRRNFEDTGDYIVRRKNHAQEERDMCDICHVKYGYDYRITRKRKEQPRRRSR